MKAFFIGLLFIAAVGILAGIGFLLSPLLLLFAFFIRIAVIILLAIIGIWLLGKLILYVFESAKK